jgi:hypothetical protein
LHEEASTGNPLELLVKKKSMYDTRPLSNIMALVDSTQGSAGWSPALKNAIGGGSATGAVSAKPLVAYKASQDGGTITRSLLLKSGDCRDLDV